MDAAALPYVSAAAAHSGDTRGLKLTPVSLCAAVAAPGIRNVRLRPVARGQWYRIQRAIH